MNDDMNTEALQRFGATDVALSVFAPDDDHVYEGIRQTLEKARRRTARAVNAVMVETYWEVGRQLAEAVGERAEYGKHLLPYLSERLTVEFGRGFDVTNLRKMRQFYAAFPKRDALRLELSWTHYRHLMRVQSEDARSWYMDEAAASGWSERELGRQIATECYERLLQTQRARALEDKPSQKEEETQEIAVACSLEPAANIFKDPYVLEFVDLDPAYYLESDLEEALIRSLRDFLLELGRGFAFVGRQQRVSDGGEDYYIDLVFFNYLLNCFVLIDLKTGKLDPRDVGQMDFYRRLFDAQRKPQGANPTVGIILCAEKSETVAKYSALADGNALLAAEYLTHLPSEEELARVLERNRREFEAAHHAALSDGEDVANG